jgi:hypothetical protein
MSLTLAIALNLVLDLGLLGALAWMMSHPRRLTAHEPAAPNVEVIQLRRGDVVEVERARRAA